jgi:hypothetical protein
MSNATLLFGKPSFTFVMGFWFLVVGFVNPLTLSVGLLVVCYGPCIIVVGFLVTCYGPPCSNFKL